MNNLRHFWKLTGQKVWTQKGKLSLAFFPSFSGKMERKRHSGDISKTFVLWTQCRATGLIGSPCLSPSLCYCVITFCLVPLTRGRCSPDSSPTWYSGIFSAPSRSARTGASRSVDSELQTFKFYSEKVCLARKTF